MAGGIFEGRPFAYNIKCIVGTAIIVGGYWFIPPKNVWVLIFLLWLPYVGMSWYDYLYDCRDKMKPTLFPFGRYIFLPFKPAGYKAEFKRMDPAQIQTMDRLDHVVGWTLLIAAVAAGYWYKVLRS